MIEKLIDKFAHTFRIEQRVDKDKLELITESYLGSKLLYTHTMDLTPLLDIVEERLGKEG